MRRVTAQSLQNAALFYLRRHSASVLQMKRVLARKVQRVNREKARPKKIDPEKATPRRREKPVEAPVDAAALIDALVAKLVEQGYLNDARLADQKASSLRRGGRSARMIRSKLQAKGLGAEVARISKPAADEAAVWVHARKKRLGPFSTKPELRKERRLKDLASLARAGFSFALAKKVVDATEVPELGGSFEE